MTAPELPAEVLALVHGPANAIAHVETLLAWRACAPEARALERIAADANVASLAIARGVRIMPGFGRFTLHAEPALAALRADSSLRRWLEPGR
jgi:hypothetical protein